MRPYSIVVCVKRFSALTKGAGVLSGCLFLLLSFFMVYETLSRHFGGSYTGFSDQVASFVLALGGTWSMAHALSTESHVRIDVVTSLYPARTKAILHTLAFFLITVLAAVLAWQSAKLAYESYLIGALVPQAMIDFPLALPQALTSLGFGMLTFQGLLMGFLSVVRRTGALQANLD